MVPLPPLTFCLLQPSLQVMKRVRTEQVQVAVSCYLKRRQYVDSDGPLKQGLRLSQTPEEMATNLTGNSSAAGAHVQSQDSAQQAASQPCGPRLSHFSFLSFWIVLFVPDGVRTSITHPNLEDRSSPWHGAFPIEVKFAGWCTLGDPWLETHVLGFSCF
jgi:hypothetical protein